MLKLDKSNEQRYTLFIEQKKGERHQRPNGGEIVRFGCAHLKDHHSLRPSCTVSFEDTDFESQILAS